MKFIRDIIGEKRQMTEQPNGVAVANGSNGIISDSSALDNGTPPLAETDLTPDPHVLSFEESVQEVDDLKDASLDENPDALLGEEREAPFGEDVEEQNEDDFDFSDILAGLSDTGEDDELDIERDVTAELPAEQFIAEVTDETSDLAGQSLPEAPRVPEAIEEIATRPDALVTPEVETVEAPAAQFTTPLRDQAGDESAMSIDFDELISDHPAEAETPAETVATFATQARAEVEAPIAAEALKVADTQPVDVLQLAHGRVATRQGRVKTRLLGFNASNDTETDPMADNTQAAAASFTKFPVGWLIVVDGPGRGAAFTLFSGFSKIGRGKDQTVALDFGDNSISRENHAAIAFDASQKSFFIGHGGKANLVRRNDRPVMSTEELTAGDTITIGETTLRFIPLCGPDFTWENRNESEWAHAANS